MSLKQIYANNVATYIDQPLGGALSDTSIYVVGIDQNIFPLPVVGSEYFLATLENIQTRDWEIVRVNQRIGNQLIVTRAQEESTVRSFPLGSKIQMRVTKETLEKIYNHSEEISTYIHQQQAPTSLWTINHNLNRLPFVKIEVGTWLNTVFTKEADAFTDIVYVNDNTITLSFSTPVAGRVICT